MNNFDKKVSLIQSMVGEKYIARNIIEMSELSVNREKYQKTLNVINRMEYRISGAIIREDDLEYSYCSGYKITDTNEKIVRYRRDTFLSGNINILFSIYSSVSAKKCIKANNIYNGKLGTIGEHFFNSEEEFLECHNYEKMLFEEI